MITFIKYIFSFLKTNWEFYDYPIQVKKQNQSISKLGERKLPKWIATIKNWHQLIGLGETKKEALQMLRIRFEEYKQKKQYASKTRCSRANSLCIGR
jgi:hypothetical protein